MAAHRLFNSILTKFLGRGHETFCKISVTKAHLAAHVLQQHHFRHMSSPPVHVIGAGLAGSEAAWQIAEAGVPVILHEMRPMRSTAAHQTDGFAELVCSNSFRSDDWEYNAVGLLHQEMRSLGSLIMRVADRHQVPAGGALAVDRVAFSDDVTSALSAHPNIKIVREEATVWPPADWGRTIVATGPLTSDALAA